MKEKHHNLKTIRNKLMPANSMKPARIGIIALAALIMLVSACMPDKEKKQQDTTIEDSEQVVQTREEAPVVQPEAEPEIILPDSGYITDTRDGRQYGWVRIGSQVWMAENINYATDSGSWIYNNKPERADIYGRLYDWETACEVCPSGWHLPGDDEWATLTDYLGGDSIAGGKLKETGLAHWHNPNEGATNEYGFTALPGGFRYYNWSAFMYMTSDGFWWTATEISPTDVKIRVMDANDVDVRINHGYKKSAFSIRCVRD